MPYTVTNPTMPTAVTSSGSNMSQIVAWYQQYLGRQPSDQEINSQLGNPGGMAAVQKLIQESDEAKAYASKSSTTTSGQPGPGNPNDPAYVRQWVDYYASQPGANPSTKTDPDYWVQKILSTGGWQGDNAGYWSGPEGMFRSSDTTPTTTTPTTTPAAQTMTYQQALAQANATAQQYLGRPLTQAEISGYLGKYGGGPGTSVTLASLSPVLYDIASKATTTQGGPAPAPTAGTPTATTPAAAPRDPFVPLDDSQSGNYDQALAIIQQRAQQYLGRPLTDAEIQGIKTKFGDAGPSGATPGTQGKFTMLDPGMTGSVDQAKAYLNSESQRLLGRNLTDDEFNQAATLVGYQNGQQVTGSQVNQILGQLQSQVPTTGGSPGTPHTYSAADINPILQDLYNQGGTSGGGPPSPTTPGSTTPGSTTPGGQTQDPFDLASFLTNSPLLAPWTTQFMSTPWQGPAPFQAPTTVDEQNDPGYQARMDQGSQAIQRSAAAKGTLLTGGTLKDLTQFGQDYGSNEYSNVYNRASSQYQQSYNQSLTDWTTNYNASLQQYQQAYNIFENNQAKGFNRIASLAGLGQTAAGQLGSSGLGYTQLAGNTAMSNANSLSNLYTQLGNVNASGIVGGANAWNNALGNAVNNTTSLYGLSQLGQKNTSTGAGGGL